MIDERQAVKEAKALAKTLGKGWTPTVWEKNRGWHCCVVHGPLAVYPQVEGKYICRITNNPMDMASKPTIPGTTRLCDTPLEAVKATVGGARVMVRKLETIVKTAEAIVDGSLRTGISFDFVYQPNAESKEK